MAGILDLLQPQANAAAVGATNAALDTAAARPFSVVLSVDDATKSWLTILLIVGIVGGALVRRKS